MYNKGKKRIYMKRRHLEKKLTELGWYFDRHEGNHDVWTNGELKILSRGIMISENLSRGIIKIAQDTHSRKEK